MTDLIVSKEDRLTALKAKEVEILKRCEGWKDTNDGSYECALHHAGYFEVTEQIRNLTESGE